MRIIDVTIPLRPGVAVWPGDVPFAFERTMDQSTGASVNVGAARLSLHTGTHADAPYHFDSTAAAIDAVPLEPYVGRCQVVQVPPGDAIRLRDVRPHVPADVRRVLFRTDAWTDHDRFPTAIPVLDLDVVEWLSGRGTLLAGLDVPSVDAIESKTLPVHHALAAHGIAIVESLDLRWVAPGSYDLVALPLKVAGADGAPLRAVLIAT